MGNQNCVDPTSISTAVETNLQLDFAQSAAKFVRQPEVQGTWTTVSEKASPQTPVR